MAKPTILIANGIMGAGGTESLLMEIFRNTSHKVRYILLVHYSDRIEQGSFDKEIRELGIQMEYIPSVGSIGIKRYNEEFKKLIERIGPIDIIHCHLNAVAGVICGAAKKGGIPVRISHCHANIKFRGSRMHILKEEISLQLLKGLIGLNATSRWACSHEAWKRLFYPWNKEIIINNMIDPRRYFPTEEKRQKAKEKFNIDGRKFIIGAVGRVAPIKNYEVIIKAIQKVPEAMFVCFGRFEKTKGYCNSLLNLAEECGVADRVKFLGNSSDIATDIHLIDVFVMPSITEGFGMAALEAQAAGLPCLVSSGLPPQLDLNLGHFSFINPYKVSDWSDALAKAISEYKHEIPDSTLIQNAFSKSGFDSKTGVEKIEDLYLSLCH